MPVSESAVSGLSLLESLGVDSCDWVAIIRNWRGGRTASSLIHACSFIAYSWPVVEGFKWLVSHSHLVEDAELDIGESDMLNGNGVVLMSRHGWSQKRVWCGFSLLSPGDYYIFFHKEVAGIDHDPICYQRLSLIRFHSSLYPSS